MEAELIALLVEVVAPPLAALLAEGLTALVADIQRANVPPSAAGVVREIIAGVNASAAFATFTGDEKRVEARRAIAQFISSHGGTADDATINALIELAYKGSIAAVA